MAQINIKKLDDAAALGLSIMSDTKRYSVENPIYTHDQWIREVRDQFILGFGDHVKGNRANPFLDLMKTDNLWYNHFYPNVADGENWVYAEVANEIESHEIRLTRLSMH